MLTGRYVELEVELDDTILSIKEQAARIYGLPPADLQRIVYGGRMLRDYRELREYLEPHVNSTFHLILRLRTLGDDEEAPRSTHANVNGNQVAVVVHSRLLTEHVQAQL
eukprot:CAMPEP_0198325782 /NCGR_PEP_ID=MMETSP1450-20131203/13448_1 /TAXON_ID=753684 ORGANISM="Madagascaria erythrocladiodes, Strain CCMP3234" /NCGR_SAMPLE_ID=MMETSP1450 /ASSEMBLY_ACC=CAM_ASM_001115 /LENGTH=108 /DNA_ID=CAMNT_0044029699 /DNA_START=202 /DNA_END=525 /DNA_ORIENTATION=-